MAIYQFMCDEHGGTELEAAMGAAPPTLVPWRPRSKDRNAARTSRTWSRSCRPAPARPVNSATHTTRHTDGFPSPENTHLKGMR